MSSYGETNPDLNADKSQKEQSLHMSLEFPPLEPKLSAGGEMLGEPCLATAPQQ